MAWQAWEAVDPGIVHGKKRRRDRQAALDQLAQQPKLEFLPHFLREWCQLRAGVSASNAHIPNPHFLREWCHLRAGVSASNAHIPNPHFLREWCHLRAGVSASNAHIPNPHFLREWCHLRAGVSASNAHIPDTVQVVSSVVLAARLEWLTGTADTALQTVHANPNYQNKPWFERVSVYRRIQPRVAQPCLVCGSAFVVPPRRRFACLCKAV